MNKLQLSHLNMSRAVDSIFDNYSSIIATTPGLSNAIAKLKMLNNDVETHSLSQTKTTMGSTAEKNSVREMLTLIAIKICAAIVAFATNTNNTSLKTQFKLKKGDFAKMRDHDLYTNAINIHASANEHGENLAPFATPEDIVQIKQLADQFYVLLPMNRALTSKGATTTANLQSTIDGIMDLITNTIDPLMNPLEFSQPSLYRDYKNARKLVDHGTRKSKNNDDEPEAKVK